jgi:Ni/Co efflux regulator RcnB
MKPLIYATLALFSLAAPVQAQHQQQNSAATAQVELNRQGDIAGPHANQTSPGNKSNPAPHVYKLGEHISRSYGDFEMVDDWSRFHLQPPPVGYHWVHFADNYLLVQSNSGLIAGIVSAS